MSEDGGFGGDDKVLTIVTVVFKDVDGLRATIQSMQRVLDAVEYWVVDGTPDRSVADLVLGFDDSRIGLLSELDDGLYDAMNKGLRLASGKFVLFLNAGDTLHENFQFQSLLGDYRLRSAPVLIGRSIETYEHDEYLRPARGRERDALTAPPHQATLYPREVYQTLRFDQERPIDADGLYTRLAIQQVGGEFFDQVVCTFELGGLSTSYDNWSVVRRRLLLAEGVLECAKIVGKVFLWRVVPRRIFYRLLAFRKYDKL